MSRSDSIPPAQGSEVVKAEVAFPDDGKLAKYVRGVDRALSTIEQGVIFALLAIVVIVASSAALADKLAHQPLGRWWHHVVRGGTFSIAMFGAVFATSQHRHLAMDLVSRRLSRRGRLILRLGLTLFTIAICGLLFRSGLRQREVVGGTHSLHVFGLFDITDAAIVTTMPIAAAMIIFHCLLHLLIDLDYLVRGKLPPEHARSGH